MFPHTFLGFRDSVWSLRCFCLRLWWGWDFSRLKLKASRWRKASPVTFKSDSVLWQGMAVHLSDYHSEACDPQIRTSAVGFFLKSAEFLIWFWHLYLSNFFEAFNVRSAVSRCSSDVTISGEAQSVPQRRGLWSRAGAKDRLQPGTSWTPNHDTVICDLVDCLISLVICLIFGFTSRCGSEGNRFSNLTSGHPWSIG